MTSTPLELYHPRHVSNLGEWSAAGLRLKVYGIASGERGPSDDVISDAKSFVRDEVPRRVEAEGEDNGLGFVIVHSGDLGVTVLAHWWAQGSVLCQHIRRTPFGSGVPPSSSERSVIACVWELALIHDEQLAWRETMMVPDASADAYLNRRSEREFV